MTFNSSENSVKAKLRDFEAEDLEEYCENNNIIGKQRENFITNSLQSIARTETGIEKWA